MTNSQRKWAHMVGLGRLVSIEGCAIPIDYLARKLNVSRAELLGPFSESATITVDGWRIRFDERFDRLLITAEEVPASPRKPAPPAPRLQPAAPLPKIAPQAHGSPSGPRGSAPAAQSPRIVARPPAPAPAAIDPLEVARLAQNHQREMAKLGFAVTATDAVAHVLGRGPQKNDPAAVAVRARRYQSQMEGLGFHVNTSEAVQHALAEQRG